MIQGLVLGVEEGGEEGLLSIWVIRKWDAWLFSCLGFQVSHGLKEGKLVSPLY